MILPKRTFTKKVVQKKKFIYGAPFSGKTYLANQFQLAAIKYGWKLHLSAWWYPPHIDIKNEVKMDGRLKRTVAWTVFKDVIDELEKKKTP